MLNRLGVNHQCDKRTDRHTDGQNYASSSVRVINTRTFVCNRRPIEVKMTEINTVIENPTARTIENSIPRYIV